MDSNDVRSHWKERSGEYSPEYYAYYGPDERSEAVLGALDQFVDRDARVLELGCSSGRHLAHLSENGFENLSGIELNTDAFDVMEETYPDLYDRGTFYADAIETAVGDFYDGQFDAVYSVETLQHLHADVEWVFDELVRITDDLLVTVENEDGRKSSESDVNYVDGEFPLYYRNWDEIFSGRGLVETETATVGRDTMRVFRTADN